MPSRKSSTRKSASSSKDSNGLAPYRHSGDIPSAASSYTALPIPMSPLEKKTAQEHDHELPPPHFSSVGPDGSEPSPSSVGLKAASAGDEDDKPRDPIARLPTEYQGVLRRQVETPDFTPTIKTLYRYASRNDLIIIAVSAVCACAAGAVLPLMTVIFGNLSGTFSNFFLGIISRDEFLSQLGHLTLNFIYLALGEFFAIYIWMVGYIYTGEHISSKIRENYLAAILRQNIGYFDKIGAGEITTRITTDTNLIQEGISEKFGLILMSLSTFITAFIIAFAKYWLLALILTSSIAGIVLIMALGTGKVIKWNREALNAYALGGTVAEEVLGSIRNATAFATQDKLAAQYASHLGRAEYWGFRRQGLLGFMLGGMMFVVYLCYALAFWMGSRFLVRHQGGVGVSEILTVLMSIMIGAFNLGGIAPNMQAFATAMAAASKIFSTIERASPLDPTSEAGRKLDHVAGDIELRNITMIYPSRPEVTVMKRVNMSVKAGQTTALVGSSGSGKSTIIGLVERFYDPVAGDILLDGVDIKELNLRFLRRQMALVSQEPTLFSTTIFGNIEHGLIGTPHEHASPEDKMAMIIKAAKMANAHDFVTGLPEGYETNVGARGFLLSGGQKQRIAIARAVVSDPKILLLDEATSALDTKSERVVQEALDRAAQGRTTIVIAHRLSTIKGADNIIVMSEGRVVEQGTHAELLEKRSAYYALVEAQKIANDSKSKETDVYEDSHELDDSDEDDDDDLELKKSESEFRMSRRSRMGLSGLSLSRHRSGKSVASIAMQEAKSKEEAEANKKYKLWELVKLTGSFNKAEWPVMVIGLLASMVAGGAQPTQAVFFAKCIVALSKPPFLYDQLRSEIDYWCWFYFMLAWVILLAFGIQGMAFAYCSERLVHKSRDGSFRRMLRQDIAFYDRDENSAGALTTFLAQQTNHLAGLSGVTLGTILNVVTTLISCFVLSLAIGWKLALVCIACVPILLLCGFLRLFLLARLQARSKKAYETSASYACEATSAIRTVASLTREQDVWDRYHRQVAAQGQASLRSVATSSTLYAASQSFMFLCVAVGFYYGGVLIADREYGLEDFFIVFSAVIFGSQSAGTVFSFAPDMGKAKSAAVELKRLFDRQPPIDNWSTAGEAVPDTRGHVEFRDVHFRYPTRPEQPVLRGLNLTVKPGQYVALVGPSGCGKSTTIQLLERFYDPQGGAVLLDGRNIASLRLQEYRSHLALVSQEPTLYQGTIRDNVLLGADRPDADVPDAAIEQACRDANIYNFIASLPEGFDTVVGNKGVMLSGGQKQRIAIARALLRNPRVLLLDEATSALDSESEKVVQAALDQAAKGRTTVAVAHRLSTIQRADCIYVFDGGMVVERGTHQELMKQGGRYFELVRGQSLEKV